MPAGHPANHQPIVNAVEAYAQARKMSDLPRLRRLLVNYRAIGEGETLDSIKERFGISVTLDEDANGDPRHLALRPDEAAHLPGITAASEELAVLRFAFVLTQIRPLPRGPEAS